MLAADLPVFREIYFVADQYTGRTLVRMLLDGLDPVFNTLEGLFVCHIVRNYNAIRPLVERVRNGPEPLLARGIPDLYRYLTLICLGLVFFGGEIQS